MCSVNTFALMKQPNTKEASSKLVQERRWKVSKLKDALNEEQQLAIRLWSVDYVNEIMLRWDKLHAAKHLIPPFAECFRTSELDLSHGCKSRFLKHLTRGRRNIVLLMNGIASSNAPN
ncbi:hypothetical protein BWQ96_03991 [Gracilariopsis chorda]|uniref:Uncharacterized protein n=1 Tax=Gracilariopsis chorda TaxID=448386 RepID=A0A2V3IW69_9FLOR|nr:hypothetical protein BWQ96_03991 [Gracilariopsis chorda]|eukprot:PXF46335.1 hypothetical protein BWQ96_03991 [Gracilariopsis chorda]